MSSALNNAMEIFDALSLEEKEYAVEQIKRRIIEARREKIHQTGKQAIEDYKLGKLKGYSNIDDLMEALNAP